MLDPVKRSISNKRYREHNRKIVQERFRKWAKSNPERIKNNKLKHYYGITLSDFNSLVKKQDEKCALCKKKEKLVIDHNHKTGRIRGLLCKRCNYLMAGVDWYYGQQAVIDVYLIGK